jgi:hypothetical protein
VKANIAFTLDVSQKMNNSTFGLQAGIFTRDLYKVQKGRPALPLPHYSRAKDHRRPLVGPAVLRPQAAAAELLLKRESGPWPGLIPRAPLSPQRYFLGFAA